MIRVFLAIFVALITGSCRVDAPSTGPPGSAPAPERAAASFINKVWTVAESEQVAIGDLRVFLSDGTLVMASPHGTPAFGTWSYDAGRLTITEEGLKYNVEILDLTSNTFRIRIDSRGEPVVIRFVPAESRPPSGTAETAAR